jgi:hypothetical protein
MNPSEEQQFVIDNISKNINIIVDACAGSGKSTTILSCAQSYPSLHFLQLTYNAQLKEEVKESISKRELTNIQVHTFHSLAVKYYHAHAFDDNGIRLILRDKIPPKIAIPRMDVLVLDEAQDMTFLLFQFIVKYTVDYQQSFQLLILGDKRQGLYEFKGSFIGYLVHAQKIWENHPLLKSREFLHCSLQTSYRITNYMADFVNIAMLNDTRLLACKSGVPVKYIRRELFHLTNFVITNIRRLVLEQNASYGDFFILAGSLKRYEIKRIENELVQSNIPCYIGMMENQDRLDNRVIENKVVFSSFHAVKGRQRRFVFVIGFDSSYVKNYERDGSIHDCPNTMYVACTRATEGLFLLENEKYYRPLPFLKLSHTEMQKSEYIDFIGNPLTMAPILEKREKEEKIKIVTPTSLIQFIPENVLDKIIPILDRIFVSIDVIEKKDLEIPSIIQTKNGFEEVSDLNGNTLPIMFYDYLSEQTPKKNILQTLILSEISKFKKNEHTFLKEMVQYIPETCEYAKDYLFLANMYLAIEEKLYSKIKQIETDEYNWLSDSMIQECFQRLELIIGEECRIGEWEAEKTILYSSAHEDHVEIDHCLSSHLGDEYLYRFTARTDLITASAIWEWKCTSKLTTEHKIQLVIYYWLWKMVYKTPKKCYLFNIKTGELLELKAEIEEMTEIVVEIIRGKYTQSEKKTEMEFICESMDVISSLLE